MSVSNYIKEKSGALFYRCCRPLWHATRDWRRRYVWRHGSHVNCLVGVEDCDYEDISDGIIVGIDREKCLYQVAFPWERRGIEPHEKDDLISPSSQGRVLLPVVFSRLKYFFRSVLRGEKYHV